MRVVPSKGGCHVCTRSTFFSSVVAAVARSVAVAGAPEPVHRVEDGHEAVEVDGGLGGQQRG